MSSDHDNSLNPTDVPNISRCSLSHWQTLVSYHGLLLGLICAVVTILLLVIHQQTKEGIAAREMEDRLVSLNQVLPKGMYDNLPTHHVLHIKDQAMGSTPVDVYLAQSKGQLSAVAFQVTTVGYGGPMTLMLGVDKEGKVLGVRVITHKETPGLTSQIDVAKSKWILIFNGMSKENTPEKEWHVKKDGGKIDQFSGATITPRAIVKGVYEGLQFFDRHKADFVKTTNEQATGAKS